MTEKTMQHLADSAFLKITQYVITGVFVPILLWSVYNVMDRLTKIEEAINRSNTISATVELRLQSMEAANIARDSHIERLNERTSDHGYRIRRLEEKTDERKPK